MRLWSWYQSFLPSYFIFSCVSCPGVGKVPCNPSRGASLGASSASIEIPPSSNACGQVAPSVSPWPGLCLGWCFLGSGVWEDRACLALITQKWSLGTAVIWTMQLAWEDSGLSVSYKLLLYKLFRLKLSTFRIYNSINQTVFTDHAFLLFLFVIWQHMVAFCKMWP